MEFYDITKREFSSAIWVDSETLKGNSGEPFSAYCNRHGDTAYMHFVKHYKNIHNFYCSAEIFSSNINSGNIIEMKDELGNKLRVVPFGYHSFNNLFCIEDLLSSNICEAEIGRMRKNKKNKE